MKKEISKIVLGTWSWGKGLYGGDQIFGNSLDGEDLQELVDFAIKNNLVTFDTAYAYGLGASETTLARLISNYREKIVISDKFTPNLSNENSKNPIIDMLNGSLDRLGVDFIDIYWIHNSYEYEKFTPFIVDAFKTGKIGKIGISNHSLAQLKKVEEILKPFGLKIEAIQNHFSLLYRNSIEDGLLDYCKENNIQFFSYMVLEQGALSGKYNENNPLPADSARGKKYNPLFPALKELLAGLDNIAKKYEATTAQILTAWAIAKGTTPILGVTKKEQVEDISKAINLNLSSDDISYLEKLAIDSKVNTHGGWEREA